MNKKIKSVGYVVDSGEILDDRKGIPEDFVEFFEEGEKVSFKNGLKDLKKFIEDAEAEEVWSEIENKLLKLKEEVGEKGFWKCWGVEYDWNLGVELK